MDKGRGLDIKIAQRGKRLNQMERDCQKNGRRIFKVGKVR
jgi:hypothetical protein